MSSLSSSSPLSLRHTSKSHAKRVSQALAIYKWSAGFGHAASSTPTAARRKCEQGVIRYHPALARNEGREKRKKMAVLEINDWDDSVTSCLCGKKGERERKKDRCVEKKRLIRPPTPPDTLKSLINSRSEP